MFIGPRKDITQADWIEIDDFHIFSICDCFIAQIRFELKYQVEIISSETIHVNLTFRTWPFSLSPLTHRMNKFAAF